MLCGDVVSAAYLCEARSSNAGEEEGGKAIWNQGIECPHYDEHLASL